MYSWYTEKLENGKQKGKNLRRALASDRVVDNITKLSGRRFSPFEK